MSWASAVIDCKLRLQRSTPVRDPSVHKAWGVALTAAIGSTVGLWSPTQLGARSLGIGVAQACVSSIKRATRRRYRDFAASPLTPKSRS